ncbi:DNA-binding GntR family transcriptional regulator [Microbacterium endophyticum]|uniref:DNA-binding GntR family transcriptional regulator n=1 Tax=Microbacterium endophyticum TaxID=1526412 RepID=A0A7W4V448_9MICO|nr:GntR family transcriptional regulator [Microbacterium endophyticum]MBB2976497.1 DNA-binding GntR family transcriptional regulator [Microbacterium endophyticum]NIK35943.1 DNA-binding GntR family transcriptional regulator [Microbacterium endophyticum]
MATQTDGTIYASLREAILSLDLVPGEKLSERGLEALLGASRTPIRAALMRLENEGLTERVGRGWQVTPIDLAEIRAVMEYREAIEKAAVALAIDRADAEELATLRALVDSAPRDDSEESGLRDGGDFHLALARLSRNSFLADAVGASLTRLSRTRWLEVRTAESRALARAEHVAIIAAMSAGDAERADTLISAHVRGTRDRLMAHLSEEHRRLRGRGFSIIESSTTPPPLPNP